MAYLSGRSMKLRWRSPFWPDDRCVKKTQIDAFSDKANKRVFPPSHDAASESRHHQRSAETVGGSLLIYYNCNNRAYRKPKMRCLMVVTVA